MLPAVRPRAGFRTQAAASSTPELHAIVPVQPSRRLRDRSCSNPRPPPPPPPSTAIHLPHHCLGEPHPSDWPTQEQVSGSSPSTRSSKETWATALPGYPLTLKPPRNPTSRLQPHHNACTVASREPAQGVSNLFHQHHHLAFSSSTFTGATERISPHHPLYHHLGSTDI